MAAAPDPDSAALGERIRRRRVALGLSQERLAELSGLDRTSVGRIENGKQGVGARNLIRVARALGCDPGDLLRGLGS